MLEQVLPLGQPLAVVFTVSEPTVVLLLFSFLNLFLISIQFLHTLVAGRERMESYPAPLKTEDNYPAVSSTGLQAWLRNAPTLIFRSLRGAGDHVSVALGAQAARSLRGTEL